ncbi:hypothetical protein HX109_08685 [Galbibacter sp. BG1]|uniref:hypothetical protein n=1 Tax=Galbibacter sp. BG1 TaxID=1170699 RepID=UPI0015BFF357|nr:hypothetical protein [Galbibacter sp. BG1]QLE01635.1 hypothetical protein HX109_08685 [Galbibacter sp. BG1]
MIFEIKFIKNWKLTLLIFPFLLLNISCSDEEYKFYIVENPGAIFIDNDQSNYSKGELLWVNINILDTQKDQFTNSEIDIFKLTGSRETFVNLSIFKIDSSEISAIALNPDSIQVEFGSIVIQDNFKILGRAIHENGQYEMRVGIPLIDSGMFFLANSDHTMGDQTFAFNTDGNNEIQFKTHIRNSNKNGRFEFVVKD